jgi:hypothetical protein
MALADWDFSSLGAIAVLTDGTSPGTGTSVLDLSGGFTVMRYIAMADTQDCAIETFTKIMANGSTFGHYLRATTNAYNTNFGFRTIITASGSNFDISIAHYLSGSPNILATSSGVAPLTGTSLDWQKWRFSAYTLSGVTYLRVELWNGSAYVPLIDVGDGDGTLAATSSKVQIWSESGSHIRFDDVKTYDLT